MNQYDIHELKTAAVVLSGIADGIKDTETKAHTKMLAAVVIKAVKELEPLIEKGLV